MKILLVIFQFIFAISSCSTDQITDQTLNTMDSTKIVQAVEKNNLKLVEQELQKGMNVNTVDTKNRSLLLIATNNQNQEMAELLVKHGANVNQQADNLDSPFLYAGASGQTQLVKLFIENGARFDIFNRYYGSALIPACERGHVQTVYLLANTKNFPINHINRLGWTGLMEAVILGDGSKKYQQIIQILKDAGADMNIPDHDGVTPLQHAERRDFKEIISIIKS